MFIVVNMWYICRGAHYLDVVGNIAPTDVRYVNHIIYLWKPPTQVCVLFIYLSFKQIPYSAPQTK